MPDDKKLSLISEAPAAGEEVEKKEAVIMTIIPPEDLRDATLDEIKLALVDEMERILHDIATLIYVNFRSKSAKPT